MLERTNLEIKAAGYPAKVIAGRIAVDQPSQNPTVAQPKFHAKIYTRAAAITNPGTVTPKVAKIIASLSCHFPRFKAEIIPVGIPINNDKIKAVPPIMNEAGKPPEINSTSNALAMSKNNANVV